MSMGTDQLATAIDSLLAVDPNELTDTELHHLITTVQRQRHRMAAAAASALSAWDTRNASMVSRSSVVRLCACYDASSLARNVSEAPITRMARGPSGSMTEFRMASRIASAH